MGEKTFLNIDIGTAYVVLIKRSTVCTKSSSIIDRSRNVCRERQLAEVLQYVRMRIVKVLVLALTEQQPLFSRAL